MLYIDTSVLLLYTLTQAVEKDRSSATAALFARVVAGILSGATSFYALHEVYAFALDNVPDFLTGAACGKAALEKPLALPLQILPFVSRVERKLHARKFTALRDSSEVPHAIAASVYGCEASLHMMSISELFPTSFDPRQGRADIRRVEE